jgi:hypothetical protein
MHFLLHILLIAASLAVTTYSHGLITKPTPHGLGAKSLAACGLAVTNNINGDLTSHVEGLPEAAKTDPNTMQLHATSGSAAVSNMKTVLGM